MMEGARRDGDADDVGLEAKAAAAQAEGEDAESAVEVKTVDVVVDAEVPGNAAVRLQQSADLGAVREQLGRAVDGGREASCGLSLGARLMLSGTDVDQIVRAAEVASFSFTSMIDGLDTSSQSKQSLGWARTRDATDRELQKQFHSHITETLRRGGLERRESMALLADFTSAETLLQDGVEEYVRAVRKVLRTGLDDSVTISFEDLTYMARLPKIASSEGYNTVARQLFRIMCGCCLLSGRAVRNAMRGAPPIEYEETPILRNLTGMIKPGRLTLVLGPPGCGKTSFLRAVAGKTLGSGNPGTQTTGDLRYNERPVSDLKNLAAWVSYVGQSDEHQSLLTVRETLRFAFRCRKESFYTDAGTLQKIREYSGETAVNRMRALKDVEVEIALALLGLTDCADTIIGNENLKGVSGGERRRVTLGEMLVTGSQVLCCDEISTGLDSAATFDITAYLRSAAHALHKSIIVALLQPPPEVIELFDDILVLAEGQIIYHGPREGIQGYFEGLGFRIPEGKDLGDFVVELPTRNGLDMQLSPAELTKRGLPRPPETADEFAERWRASQEFAVEVQELHTNHDTVQPRMFDYDDVAERGFFLALWHTVVWSMTLRLRDRIQIVARIVANMIVGLFFGTLFYQLSIDDWWLKAMLFAMALIFLVSTAFPTVQIMSQQRPIFYKHVEARFYSSTQFTLAQALVSIPFVCFDIACFGTALYWMCNLAPHINNFLVFLGVCISFGICMNTIMSMFPFITPDEDTGIVIAALYLILSVVASGAISTESMIPILFRWMVWVNPFAWSYRALAINEYHTEEYDVWPCHFEMVGKNITLPVNCQSYFLQVREVRDNDAYIPGAVLVNLAFTGLFLAIMSLALATVRFEKEKTGAIPGESSTSARDKGKRSVIERNNAKRAYEHQKYLDAVSPRTLHDLASANLPKVSPLGGGTGNGDLEAGAGGSTPGSALTSPLLLQQSAMGSAGNDSDGGFHMVQVAPKTLVVRDLWYTIPIHGEPIDFLKGITFHARPSRMIALVGQSGAGKSTLMDCIAGRKTVGYARGEILVNGEPKVQYKFVKYTGYVEQFGVHAACATIKESLEFSANLRLPASTPAKQRDEYVQRVLRLLELDEIENALAGSLSMEQNKRLTLGVELVANPSIIFCDEPTSGLDARAAAIVMRVLLKVARTGRTVMCTIHQPSTAIFNFFDDMLLLKRGGEVVYFGELGPNSKTLVDYLEAVPSTKKFDPTTNPSTWALEVIGAGTGADGRQEKAQKDYAEVYRASKRCREVNEEVDVLLAGTYGASMGSAASASNGGAGQLGGGLLGNSNSGGLVGGLASPLASPFSHAHLDNVQGGMLNASEIITREKPGERREGVYVRGELAQIKLLLRRNLQTYWRSPEFSLNRLLVVMTFTVVFACFFFMSKLENASDVEGRIVNIFFFSSLTSIYCLYTLIPNALSRRALYYRERAANMYSVNAFNIAELAVELPWIVIQVVITVPVIYFLTNLNTTSSEPFIYFVVIIFLILVLMTSMGLFASSLFPDPLAAQLASVGALITLMVFCGIMVPLQDLPKAYIPMYYASFYKYSSEGLMVTQFHNLNNTICLPDGLPLAEDNDLMQLIRIIQIVWPKFDYLPCTRDGTFEFKNFFHDVTQLSGIQETADTFVLGDFARDYEYSNRWMDLGVLIGWTVALRILTYITMVNVNHQKR